MSELVTTREVIGSVAWVMRTGGRLTVVERASILVGAIDGLLEGFALRRKAKAGARETVLARFAPPATPMVEAARAYLAAHSHPSMVNHAHRTAYWALVVLDQSGQLGELDLETTWVAALLHDVGLDEPPPHGDFSLGGVQVLRALARERGWRADQTDAASEAIATNLSTRVEAARSGTIAWAMNVGGIGEIGIGPHRGLMHPQALAELETRYTRDDFRETALRLIAAEARRVPGGRFALFRPVFRVLMR